MRAQIPALAAPSPHSRISYPERLDSWHLLDVDELPSWIAMSYAKQGHFIVQAWMKLVVCWDGRRKIAYRVISTTGRECIWRPSSWPLTPWMPELQQCVLASSAIA